ncbi:LysE family translocator [Psychromarinibacter sp. C21-152]|uniref:LysE family translocator n=1 Tax=Psychromarinibacter sediminicola TaxID=3033385 RepID=A0AAE3TBT3_9RHOB|nr:LysE family translocator [Psychromarinibacter sediminicola]MDF0603279.1 LysE family translocator [Psychromarinibacter sediminicola]
MEILPYLPGFLAAYGILAVAATSPGPAVAMLVGISMGQGRAPALVTSLGIACGSVLLNLGTLVGVGLILNDVAWAMQVLRLVGAGYLLYLAWGAFRKAAEPPEFRAVRVARLGWGRLWLAGVLLQITNPKAIVFWLAIASIGATEGGGAGIVALFLLGSFAISFGCHGAWALVLSAAPVRAAYQRARRGIESALGAFFCFAAWRLATARG